MQRKLALSVVLVIGLVVSAPNLLCAETYYTVVAKHKDEPDRWQKEVSFVITSGKGDAALKKAGKSLAEKIKEDDVTEAKIVKTSDNSNEAEEVDLFSQSTAANAGEASDSPVRPPTTSPIPPMVESDEKPTTSPGSVDAAGDILKQAEEAYKKKAFGKAIDLLDKAIDLYDKAIRSSPDDKELYLARGVAHQNRDELHPNSDDSKAAVDDFSKAIDLGMKTMDVYFSRAMVHDRLKKYSLAVYDYRIAFKLGQAEKCDDAMLALISNNLAWHLAVCPDEKIRNGDQAWEYAKKANDLVPKNPDYMSTLAAAYAECADYEEAVKWAKKALAAYGTSNEEAAAVVRSELELFQKGKPYRDK